MGDDITFCMNENCKHKKCFRHNSNIKDRTIPHSYAIFEGTEDCPYKGKTMTYKEAIEHLNNKLNIAYFTAEDNEALDLAIEALKKLDK